MQIILGSTFDMIGRTYNIWPPNEHKNLHFKNECDIHMNTKSYEANGYGYDLDLLIISHYLHVS
jgi:hypothetical protein